MTKNTNPANSLYLQVRKLRITTEPLGEVLELLDPL